MGELRKDYLLDRWVIISSGRGKRPKEFKKEEFEKKEGVCFFCPGSEHLTPPEIGRIDDNGNWEMRWFPNKFPAVEWEGNPNIETHNSFFTFANNFGQHDVLVETPNHDEQLWDLGKDKIKKVFQIYSQRITELSKLDNVKYVVVFKNHGRQGGTSLIHSHTQIASVNIIPTNVMDEIRASASYGDCPLCNVIEIEKKSDRRCFENPNFVAFCPYASRFNFEIWVFPKRHVKGLDELSDDELNDLADIMDRILKKLREINVSYNYFLHYAPKGNDLHFHIEVTPRIATWAGFEINSGIIINSVPPEFAAKFYRGEE